MEDSEEERQRKGQGKQSIDSEKGSGAERGFYRDHVPQNASGLPQGGAAGSQRLPKLISGSGPPILEFASSPDADLTQIDERFASALINTTINAIGF